MQDYLAEIEKIVGGEIVDGSIRREFNWESPQEAKLHTRDIRHIQKQLRFLKRQINAEVKAIRFEYREKKQNVSAGLLSLFAGKGFARSDIADKKRTLTHEQNRKIEPHEKAKIIIDNILMQLDSFKLEIEKWIHENA